MDVTSGKTMRQIRSGLGIFRTVVRRQRARPFFFFFFLPFFHPLPKTSRIVENKKLNATCNARQGFFLRSRRQRKRNMENGAGGGAPTEQKSEWIDTCRTHVQPGVEKNQGTTLQLVHDADLMYRRYRIPPPMEMRGCIRHHWNVSSP